MTGFPPPLPLAEHVSYARTKKQQLLNRLLIGSLIAKTTLVSIEWFGALYFHVEALRMDALVSTYDLVLSTLLLLVCQLAQRPPDRHHPFGHGRIEPLASFLVSWTLFLAGGYLLIQELVTETLNPIIPLETLLCVLPGTLFLTLSGYALKKYGRVTGSGALVAEGGHYYSDAINGLIVSTSIFFAHLLPTYAKIIDKMGAVLICLSIILAGIQGLRAVLEELLDASPDPELLARVREAAFKVEEVLGVEKLHVQRYGPDAHVDIDIEVEPEMSVHQAHLISQRVRHSIQSSWSQVRGVTVHLEPFFPNDHSV